MFHRLSMTSLAIAVASIGTLADSRNTDAQGLFRRIQSRIQSRIQTPPNYRPPTPAPGTRTQPQYTPRVAPQPNSSASRTQPQRVQPMTPGRQAQYPNSAAQPKRAAQPRSASEAGSAAGNRATAPPDRDDSVSSEKFGGSILAPMKSAKPAVPESPQQQSSQTASALRPSLGIQVLESRSGVPGLEVAGFRAGTLAQEAGLQIGDVIVAVDGTATPTIADIARLLEDRKVGDRVRARIVRGRSTTAIEIPLRAEAVAVAKPGADSSPQMAPSPQMARTTAAIDYGIDVRETPGVRGLVISRVTPNSSAAEAGLQVGDRIVSLDGRLIRDLNIYNEELGRRQSGDNLSFRVVRNDAMVAADVKLTDQRAIAKTDSQIGDRAKGDNAGGKSSVMEGLGSMLGGLLGGDAQSKNATPKTQKSQTQTPQIQTPKDNDEMAFGDDEPIEQVGYESEIQRAIKKLEGDPPSLETLELPPGDASPIDASRERAEKLREEIRQLEERLKELESNQ